MKPRIGSVRNKHIKLYRQKRDYHSKSFRNPFFVRRDPKVLKWQFNILLALVIIGGFLYLFSYSDLYLITNIEITGGKDITRELLREMVYEQQGKRRFLIFSQGKLPFFEVRSLKKNINELLVFDSLTIEKDYRNTLRITFSEKNSQAYLLNQGQIFSLDNDSRIISILDNMPASTSLPIFTYNERNLIIGEVIGDQILVSDGYEVYQQWRELELEPPMTEIQLVTDLNEFRIRTQYGWQVYLSREFTYAKQLISLKRLLQEHPELYDRLQYVDLRVDGWLYYK